MTRDQWMRRCAQRFIDKADMDAGSAAACAEECARDQRSDRGLNPAGWLQPESAADEVLRYWDDADAKRQA